MPVKVLSPAVKFFGLSIFFSLAFIISVNSSTSAAAVRPGFNANSLEATDDGSSDIVPLGFSINFVGGNYDSAYVNNNGNITFGSPLRTFTPTPINNAGVPIIAPFWADVDTSGSGSGITRYGTGTVDGRNAFGVNWVNIGYYEGKTDKLNSFQLVLIDRSDRAPGAFDIEFNYDNISWETGDASGGTNGLGGSSARAGYWGGASNDFELPGSGVNGAFLNSNAATGLINKSKDSTVPGRYIFEFSRVAKVEYEQIDTTDLGIDANPNAGGGRRIFPDKKDAVDTVDRRRIRVKAQYGENIANARIYFRSFDPDDPSANTAPIDNEATANAGDDNNGNVDGTTATRAGQLSIPQPNPNGCQTFAAGISCLTDAYGIATADFITTRQPGDNFIVAASANETYLTALTLAADGINLKETSGAPLPVTTLTANDCLTSSLRGCRAEMLTVWRRLHIEVDSMGNVSGNREIRFIERQTIPAGTVTVNLPGAALEVNRFENGRATIGLKSYKIAAPNPATGVNANGTNSVTIINPSVYNVFTANTRVTLYDDDDFNNNDGTALIGDIGEDVPMLDRTYLEDSDNPILNHFTPAYIVPKYDVGNNNDFVAFQLNVLQDTPLSVRSMFEFNQVATEAAQDYWTIYLLSAYQHTVDEDEDPETDVSTAGIVDRIPDALGITRAQGAAIFFETDGLKDCPPAPSFQPEFCNINATKLHEIGHLFGAEHGEDGVMDSRTTNFSNNSLAAIRRRNNP